MVSIRIVSYNVKGLRNEKKRRKIFNHLHDQKVDIALLQETHSVPDDLTFWRSEWGGEIIFSHGMSNARGVAILIGKKLNCQVKDYKVDIDGRIVAAELLIDNIAIVLTSLYAPNIDDELFFANAFSMAEQLQGSRIICGDFNTVLNVKSDMKGGKGFTHPKSSKFINDYLEENDMIDIWRTQHPDVFASTYIQHESSIASSLMERIDYILLDSSLQQFVIESKIMCAFASDHAIPMIQLNCSLSQPGPGYWKFNVNLLDDESFIQDVKDRITNVLSDTSMDLLDRWELMKFSVKQAAIIRGSQIVKADKAKLEVLKKKLNSVTEQRDALNLNSAEKDAPILFNDHNAQI